jgi:hypothetical protein
MTAASKNSVVVGFVAYFVGLSVLGLMIYRWSQPQQASSAHAHPAQTESHTEAHGDQVVVEYEKLDGAPETTPAPTLEAAAPTAPEAAPTEPAAAASQDEQWN